MNHSILNSSPRIGQTRPDTQTDTPLQVTHDRAQLDCTVHLSPWLKKILKLPFQEAHNERFLAFTKLPLFYLVQQELDRQDTQTERPY